MKYLSKLIPKEHRVLPGYFKGSVYDSKERKSASSLAVSYIGALVFFVAGLRFSAHPLTLLLFGFMGTVMLPTGHRLLERLFRFSLTRRIKSRLLLALAVCSIPLISRDIAVEKDWQAARQREVIAERRRQAEQKKRNDAQQAIERQRLAIYADSFSKHLKRAREFKSKHRYADARASLANAESFVTGENDRQQLDQESADIDLLNIDDLIAHRNYKQAIPEIDRRLQEGGATTELLCKRAVCYSKTGRTADAVADLKVAMEGGSEEAGRLHDRINPIRRRVLYYLTRCCDGTASPTNAKGRGACSHHGGVCNWNEPVYEEYRQYE